MDVGASRAAKWAVLSAVLSLAACSKSPSGEPAKPLVAPVAPLAASDTKAPPTFIEDDYPSALAEARKRGVPLFVDGWAPWCHTCLSLRAYVLHDPAMGKVTDKFVWLAIDTEREKNAPFLAKFPMENWPTLFVIDPKTEKAALKWPGSLTVNELTSLLEDAAVAVSKMDPRGGEAGAALVRGDQAAAAGKSAEAIKEYRVALATAQTNWPKRARVVDSLTTQLARSKSASECVSTASTELPRLLASTSAANVALTGLSCASGLAKTDPSYPLVPSLASAVEQMAGDRSLQILADDRSGLFEQLISFHEERGEKGSVRKIAQSWSDFLDGEAASAKTPAARAVFDAHRLLAYTELGTIEKAVPMLEASERDFPDDYNPPARLAKALFDLKRYDDALAASDRALKKAYGPRKLRLYSLRADILTAKGDKAGAKTVLAQAVKESDGMKLEGGYARLSQDLKTRLSQM